MIDFERASKITQDFLKAGGHNHFKLETTIPRLNGWDFHYDVGVVLPQILLVSIGFDGKIKRLLPLWSGVK